MLENSLIKQITSLFQEKMIHVIKLSAVSGGCIHLAYCFETDKGIYFVKVNKQNKNMFASESAALQALSKGPIRVPQPIFVVKLPEAELMVLEWLDLKRPHPNTHITLGQQLALLHSTQTAPQFGFEMDNFIGSTPQPNLWTEQWVDFFRTYRLAHQLKLIYNQFQDTLIFNLGEKLINKLEDFFKHINLTPSLLHGDLWNGNWAMDPQGMPIIFDPASYYGHHEAELSIMHLFGGFSQECFSAYHEILPKEPGFEERLKLYQLYHVLNHTLLFGGNYRNDSLALLKSLI